MIIDVNVSEANATIETSVSVSETVGVEIESQSAIDINVDAQQHYQIGTNNHDDLFNREVENQHPISAITSLQNELDSKVKSSELQGLSNFEIEALLKGVK